MGSRAGIQQEGSPGNEIPLEEQEKLSTHLTDWGNYIYGQGEPKWPSGK